MFAHFDICLRIQATHFGGSGRIVWIMGQIYKFDKKEPYFRATFTLFWSYFLLDEENYTCYMGKLEH